MKKTLKTTAILFLSLGFLSCAATGKSISTDIKGNACEIGCDEARDKCKSECAGATEGDGGVRDTACELACDEARDKCVQECK